MNHAKLRVYRDPASRDRASRGVNAPRVQEASIAISGGHIPQVVGG